LSPTIKKRGGRGPDWRSLLCDRSQLLEPGSGEKKNRAESDVSRGPSLNKGVVAAFENVLGRGLVVPKHREVLGAYGAAISLQEKMRIEQRAKSTFRGLQSAIHDTIASLRKCAELIPPVIINASSRFTISTGVGASGRRMRQVRIGEGQGQKQDNLFQVREEMWHKSLAGVYKELEGEPLMEVEGRPTVGMQRSLYTLQTGVLWAHFFDKLGFRVVLTRGTNSQIVSSGIESMTAETCFPIKISHGM